MSLIIILYLFILLIKTMSVFVGHCFLFLGKMKNVKRLTYTVAIGGLLLVATFIIISKGK